VVAAGDKVGKENGFLKFFYSYFMMSCNITQQLTKKQTDMLNSIHEKSHDTTASQIRCKQFFQ